MCDILHELHEIKKKKIAGKGRSSQETFNGGRSSVLGHGGRKGLAWSREEASGLSLAPCLE